MIYSLCSLAIFFALQTQAVSVTESLNRQQKAAISEKKFAGKQLSESAKNVLELIKGKNKAESGNCTIGGGGCNFDSDCCSDNCFSGKCQAGVGGCSIGGSSCNFDSDCCSDNCFSGRCQDGNGCSSGGGSCNFDSDCCSGNCFSGKCQAACGSTGESCTYDHECCAGNCNSRGECGADLPPNCY